MVVIGLTGGIASGKSAITQWLAERGAYVVDADKLGHRAYERGSPAFDQVVQTFGEDVVSDNGEIDRKVLGSKVFGNDEALKKLTDIAWPAIKDMAKNEIAQVREAGEYNVLVLEAAVLIEAEWQDLVDEMWVVNVDRETAIERAMARDNLTRENIEKRINAQITNEERATHATVVLNNSSSWADLWSTVSSTFDRLREAT